MHSFVLHSSIHFVRFEDVRTVSQGYVNPLADRVCIFTLERQNIGQKSLYARSPLIAIHSAISCDGDAIIGTVLSDLGRATMGQWLIADFSVLDVHFQVLTVLVPSILLLWFLFA